MSFSQEQGYLPLSFNELVNQVRILVNQQNGTSFSPSTFLGSNWYKLLYALIQKFSENETKTSEIFLKLQLYFQTINEQVNRPAVTPNGLLDIFRDRGYLISIKKMVDEDAGLIHVCVDVDSGEDDYAETKIEICEILRDHTCLGTVTQGGEVETLPIDNGQPFDFKFFLPDEITPLLRLTLTTSNQNQSVILPPNETAQKLFGNIAAKYQLGKDFEPETYFTALDAPWASDILLEYKIGDDEWTSAVYEAEFDEKFVILLENIEIVES